MDGTSLDLLRMELLDQKAKIEYSIENIPKDQRDPVLKRIQRLKEWIGLISFISCICD